MFVDQRRRTDREVEIQIDADAAWRLEDTDRMLMICMAAWLLHTCVD